jgi:hypothetical protein
MLAYVQGDPSAFHELFRRYAPLLLRLMRRALSSLSEAQDPRGSRHFCKSTAPAAIFTQRGDSSSHRGHLLTGHASIGWVFVAVALGWTQLRTARER